jgi:proliferating cell nuclear antigen
MDGHTLYLKSVQGSAIKTLFEVLKEILHDVNVTFDSSGVKLMTMDGAHVSLVHLKLEAKNFEQYHCNSKITVGINLGAVFKLIKSVGSQDILVFYISDKNAGELGIRIENSEKNAVTEYKYKLLDIDAHEISMPDVVFSSVITMPSQYFQRLVRDMANLGDTVLIKSHRDSFILSCEGDFASQETVIGEKTDGMTMSTKSEEVIEEKFSLKYLNLFTKSTSLCNTIEIYMKSAFPIILEYNVASLGYIRFCLAPKQGDD